MKEMEYVHQNRSENVALEDKVQKKQLGVRQPQDVGRPQTAEDRHLWGMKDEVSWSLNLGQQDPKPFYIKEEEEELWISQEGDKLLGEDETEYTKFPINVVVKNEDDEEVPESSQLHQSQTDTSEAEPPTSSSFKWIKTEMDGEDWGRLELIWKSDPNNIKLSKHRRAGDSSETEASEEEGHHGYRNWQQPLAVTENQWMGSQLAESGMNSDAGCNAAKKAFSCSECGKQFLDEQSLKRHMRQIILRLAHHQFPLRYKDKLVYIFSDYLAEALRQRQAFHTIRKRLQDAGAMCGFIYPAHLRVTHGSTDKTFSSLRDVEVFAETLQKL
ncbi:hypothetical protein CRENBAI_023166 [Crenichthys baileyi]|uniref:C2H2-type domain-containing protein n=1 Tax=Crenichthys baileyi TaxID=28760 RepID=A0AAV9RES5_9TELE